MILLDLLEHILHNINFLEFYKYLIRDINAQTWSFETAKKQVVQTITDEWSHGVIDNKKACPEKAVLFFLLNFFLTFR